MYIIHSYNLHNMWYWQSFCSFLCFRRTLYFWSKFGWKKVRIIHKTFKKVISTWCSLCAKLYSKSMICAYLHRATKSHEYIQYSFDFLEIKMSCCCVSAAIMNLSWFCHWVQSTAVIWFIYSVYPELALWGPSLQHEMFYTYPISVQLPFPEQLFCSVKK